MDVELSIGSRGNLNMNMGALEVFLSVFMTKTKTLTEYVLRKNLSPDDTIVSYLTGTYTCYQTHSLKYVVIERQR